MRAGERAASLFRALGDERGVALSLCLVGFTQDCSESKWSMVQAEMDSLAPEVWQLPRVKVRRFFADAVIYTTHERFDEALEAAEAGIAFARSNGFLNNAAYLTRYASLDDLGLGRLEDAERRCCEEIAHERRWRDGPLEVTLGCHATVLARQGRCAEARVALLEFFEASRRSGWALFGAFGYAFVELALHEHRYRDAARLLGYARAAWGRGTISGRESKRLLARLQSEMDATSLERLLVEGKGLDQEAVCGLTLESAPSG
jgi:hypothetical protein